MTLPLFWMFFKINPKNHQRPPKKRWLTLFFVFFFGSPVTTSDLRSRLILREEGFHRTEWDDVFSFVIFLAITCACLGLFVAPCLIGGHKNQPDVPRIAFETYSWKTNDLSYTSHIFPFYFVVEEELGFSL